MLHLEDYSDAVVRQCFNNIRAITKLAKRQKYLSEDPGEDTKMPQTKSAEKPVMLREQKDAISSVQKQFGEVAKGGDSK